MEISVAGRNFLVLEIEGISNPDEVFGALIGQDVEGAFINPKKIFSKTQVYAAIFNAVRCDQEGCVSSADVFSEIVYFLSPLRGISMSLKYAGFRKTTKSLLFITDSPANIDKMNSLNHGGTLVHEDLQQFIERHRDLPAICDEFGLDGFQEKSTERVVNELLTLNARTTMEKVKKSMKKSERI